MKRNSLIEEKLFARKWYHRLTALTVVLSLLCAFIVPLSLARPGAAATPDVVPAGAYSIENDVTGVEIGNVSGGTSSGTTITGGQGADAVSFTLTADFVINDRTHDKIDTSKPYIYLPVSKDDLSVFLAAGASNTGSATDSSNAWASYCQLYFGDNQIHPTGTYTIYPTDDGDYGYIVL